MERTKVLMHKQYLVGMYNKIAVVEIMNKYYVLPRKLIIFHFDERQDYFGINIPNVMFDVEEYHGHDKRKTCTTRKKIRLIPLLIAASKTQMVIIEDMR